MKKIVIVLFLLLMLLTGCKQVQKMSIEEVIKESTKKNLRVYNTYRKGYKYNLPKGFYVKDNMDYNEVIASRDYLYYLYVDGISFYNKVIEKYQVNDTSYKSMQINVEDKFGYLEINKLKSGKYLVEIMYNYAKIEVIVEKRDINNTVASSMSILKSVIFNSNVLKSIIGDEVTQAKEFDFNIFETASNKNSEYLEAIDADIYEEDSSIYDSDFIEQEGD